MDCFYTGIGSRQTPSHILIYMTKLAETLAISNSLFFIVYSFQKLQ